MTNSEPADDLVIRLLSRGPSKHSDAPELEKQPKQTQTWPRKRISDPNNPGDTNGGI